MEDKISNLIRETVANLLDKAGFQATIEMASLPDPSENGTENIVCNIRTEEDSSFLIGQYGANLQALQHLVRLIVRKKTDDKLRFILDVNSYRQEKSQSLTEQARSAAEQAIEERRPIAMRPMSAYERRVVHIELSKDDRVVTESMGEGEERKIVVKPAK